MIASVTRARSRLRWRTWPGCHCWKQAHGQVHHDGAVGLDQLALEGGLGQLALLFPEIPRAGQDAVAHQGTQRPRHLVLAKTAMIIPQDVLDHVWMRQHVDRHVPANGHGPRRRSGVHCGSESRADR